MSERRLLISHAIKSGDGPLPLETPTLNHMVRKILSMPRRPDELTVDEATYCSLVKELNDMRARLDEPMIEALDAGRRGVMVMGIPVFV